MLTDRRLHFVETNQQASLLGDRTYLLLSRQMSLSQASKELILEQLPWLNVSIRNNMCKVGDRSSVLTPSQ